jgi:hypothetical protein
MVKGSRVDDFSLVLVRKAASSEGKHERPDSVDSRSRSWWRQPAPVIPVIDLTLEPRISARFSRPMQQPDTSALFEARRPANFARGSIA